MMMTFTGKVPVLKCILIWLEQSSWSYPSINSMFCLSWKQWSSYAIIKKEREKESIVRNIHSIEIKRSSNRCSQRLFSCHKFLTESFLLTALTFTATGEVDGPLEEEEEGLGCRKDGVMTGASEADSVDDSIGSSTEEPIPLVSPSVSTPGIICDSGSEF